MEDGTEFVRIFAQDQIETATKLRGLDLALVPLAHSRDFVGKKNSAFEKIEFSKKFDAAQSEEALVQIGQAKIESPKTPLLSDVMNREHGCERQMMRSHINRHQRGRPIVHMQNLRCRSQTARQLHRRFAEKNKTRGVIVISGSVFTVNSVAIKKLVTPDKE